MKPWGTLLLFLFACSSSPPISSAPTTQPTPPNLAPLEATETFTEQPITIRQFNLPYSPTKEEVTLPAWTEPLISSLSCDCHFDCEELSAELPIIGTDQAGYRYDADYVPRELVLIAEFRFGYALRSDTQLHAKAIEPLRNFMQHLERNGHRAIIRSGYRSYEEQARLYQEEPNAAAPPGHSQHQSGFAFDIHKRTEDNQVGAPIPFSREIAQIANTYGIVHPFDWDRPHYLVLDAVCPGATQALIAIEQNPNNSDVIFYFLEGLKRQYRQQALRFSGYP